MEDLFGYKIIKQPLLREKFIEPPFSVLDSKNGQWRNRVKKWKNLGIKSEIGRETVIKKSSTLKTLIDKTNNHTGNDGVSIFDPALCEIIYKWFCPENGLILDPFAGGSVRGIVANYMGYKYTGIDIREEQVISNREQALEILDVNNQPQWYIGDSNVVLDQLFNHEFNLIFTCPPYADLEIYSDLEGDISNMSYSEFITAYKSIIRKSIKHLVSGGFAVFVVGEVRDKRGNYVGLVPDTINAMIDAGMNYYNECIYLQGLGGACLTAGKYMSASKKLKKIHQNVLVFKKP